MSFRKAKASRIGGKFLVFGGTGSGKSFFGLTFPRSIAVDSETGLAHYEGMDITLNNGNTYNNLLMVDDTNDLDTLEEDLDEFETIAEENKAETLIVDSETKLYSGLQIAANAVEEKRARRKGNDVEDTTISVRSWGRIKLINMRLQQMKIDLSAKGYHIVSVAQEVDIKNDDGTKIIGHKPDCYKSLPFDYDVVCRFYNKKDKDGKVHYYAEVLKDRTNVTKIGDVIENPCYDIWKDYFESRNKLEIKKTNYKEDMKTSEAHIEDESAKAETLAVEWKSLMKEVKESGNADGISKIQKFLKENTIDVKKLDIQSVATLTELVDFTKLQLQ